MPRNMNRESRISVLARLRRLRLPLGRALLAAFVASWLGLAVQPCMAEAATGPQDASPAATTAHHDGCGGGAAPEPVPEPQHPCPHCPQGGGQGDCGTALDCEAAGVPGILVKAAESPRADLGAWIDLPADPPAAQSMRAPPGATFEPVPSRTPPRNLQQRYCRFQK